MKRHALLVQLYNDLEYPSSSTLYRCMDTKRQALRTVMEVKILARKYRPGIHQ